MRRKIGAVPGAVVYTGPQRDYGAHLQLIHYQEDSLEETEVSDIASLPKLLEAPGVHWLNVVGVHDTKLLENLGQVLGLHPLTVEDLASLGQRPKTEEYEHYLFMVFRILTRHGVPVTTSEEQGAQGRGSAPGARAADPAAAEAPGAATPATGPATPAPGPATPATGPAAATPTRSPAAPAKLVQLEPSASAGTVGHDLLHSEQFSLVLREGLLVTFQELERDPFEPLRERLRKGAGRLRKMGADYLAYTLIDLVIDQYFEVVEAYGDDLEAIEEKILRGPERDSLERVNDLRRDLLVVRRAVWPLRDVMASLQRKDQAYFSPEVSNYLRDAHDHAVQVMDAVETQREQLTSLHDIYLTLLSVRMNDVMKVLTIIATIFIPLTFLAGIYGMNFKYMPEYHWRWAYPALWLVMLLLGGGMLAAFRRRGWL
ncbi:MAG: magnesium/cobalt transporter CorA [Truepera sp.]|nr:magnesium/cobalt transporter CorA [Truepera sp.]HRQ10648.1 magnesium/cobalt transporter CorA [Trueperaceae bacterium]